MPEVETDGAAALAARNLAQVPESDRIPDGTEDVKIPCPEGGGSHLSLNLRTNAFSDFKAHDWNDVARGLLRLGILPNYYVAKYEYTDETGKRLYLHGKRRPKEPGKAPDWTHGFEYGNNGVPREKSGKGNMDGIRRVLFDLPLLAKSNTVWITAGEKDAELLRYRFGKNATTRAFGEAHWDDGYLEQLSHAKKITIVIDNDDAGWRGGWTLYKNLVKLSGVKIRVLRPNDSVKDVFDHVNYGFELPDLQPIEVSELQKRGDTEKPKSTMAHLAEQIGVVDIDVTDDSLAIQNIARTINDGKFPELYQAGGRLFRVSGDPAVEPVTANECVPADLRAILSERAFTYKFVSEKSGSGKQKPALPAETICRAVLHVGRWKVPKLELNPNRYDIRTPEGTLNLLTGEIRESTFADMHTCQTKVHYRPELGTNCPKFMATLRSQLESEDDVQCALDGLAYSLTGDTSWQLFYWWQGVPGSGKSTVAMTLGEMLGTYATMADDELLFGSREMHPANIARLEGKRLVIQDEIPERKQMKLERLRKHTTQPTVPGRGMGENWRDIVISWKLLFTSNPKAKMSGISNDGIWRRMVLLHCDTKIPDKRRRKFYHRVLFKEEGSQILNLLLERVPRIREDGPRISENVKSEVTAYEEETDLHGQFMSLIDRREGAWLSNRDLEGLYESFYGEKPSNEQKVTLGLSMHEAKFVASNVVKCKRVLPDGTPVKGSKPMSTRGWLGAAIADGAVGFESRWVPMNPDAPKPR